MNMSSPVSPVFFDRHKAGSSIIYNSLALQTMSTVGVEELIYRWKLNIFANEYMPNVIESPIFESRKISSGRSKLSWQLSLKSEECLQGDFSKIFYVVKLNFIAAGGQKVENINAASYVRFKEPNEKCQMEIEKDMAGISFTGISERYPTVNISKILATDLFDPKKGYVVDDMLTVHCRILVRGKLKPSTYTLSSKDTSAFKSEAVAKIMKNVLATAEFSDVQLVTWTKAFPAHKAILAARSPVFAALFRSNMLESTSGRVEIHDFEESAVEALLEFVYTGVISNFAQNAMDLLRISDKYDLSELKTECEKFLCYNLNIENAVEVFILARLLDAATLKAFASKFIATNKMEISETESFKKLVQPDPSILLELFMTH